MTHDERVKLAVQLAAGLCANPSEKVLDAPDNNIATWSWAMLEYIEAEGEKRRKAESPTEAIMQALRSK